MTQKLTAAALARYSGYCLRRGRCVFGAGQRPGRKQSEVEDASGRYSHGGLDVFDAADTPEGERDAPRCLEDLARGFRDIASTALGLLDQHLGVHHQRCETVAD